jgi:hypothetical protein
MLFIFGKIIQVTFFRISFAIFFSIAFLYSLSKLFRYTSKVDYYVFCNPLQKERSDRFFTALARKLNHSIEENISEKA